MAIDSLVLLFCSDFYTVIPHDFGFKRMSKNDQVSKQMIVPLVNVCWIVNLNLTQLPFLSALMQATL